MSCPVAQDRLDLLEMISNSLRVFALLTVSVFACYFLYSHASNPQRSEHQNSSEGGGGIKGVQDFMNERQETESSGEEERR